MRERRETVLPEPEGHSRTALPPASSVFLRSHMYAYCSDVSENEEYEPGYILGYGKRMGSSSMKNLRVLVHCKHLHRTS